jgi:uncharacterized protein (DUF58 family)
MLAVGWIALVLLAAADYWWLRKHGRAVAAQVTTPVSVTRGERIEAHVTITNNTTRHGTFTVRPLLPAKGLPKAQIFRAALGAGQSSTFLLPVLAPERGAYHFGEVYLRFTAPLRMWQMRMKSGDEAICKVLPDVQPVKQYIVTRRLHDSIAPHLRTARIRGLGSEFESLRDYEDGDDIRRIDWRATAKHQKLISRNYEIEPHRQLMIVVDGGRLMTGGADGLSKLDHAVDATLMAAGVSLDGGDNCGMLLYDDKVRAYLPPRGGLGHLKTMVETVYDVQPTYVESNFQRAFVHLQTRLTKRSMVLILSDVMDVDASSAMLAGVLALARRHLVVFAALRTPDVEAVIDAPTKDDDDPFRKAVAYRLMAERTQVMARMQKGGVQVLDVRPHELTIPLVNKYIELREMNLL